MDFSKAMLPIASGAWQLSAGNDLRFPGAVSNEPKSNSLLGKALEGAMVGYMENVFKLAGTDLQVRVLLPPFHVQCKAGGLPCKQCALLDQVVYLLQLSQLQCQQMKGHSNYCT